MRRILITPKAIKMCDPCHSRWVVYRQRFKGEKAHPLADLLTRQESNAALYDDFSWVLNVLPQNSITSVLKTRLKRSWLASPHLPSGSWLRRYSWMTATGCILGLDLPTDWKERALAVIEKMEREAA